MDSDASAKHGDKIRNKIAGTRQRPQIARANEASVAAEQRTREPKQAERLHTLAEQVVLV